MPEPTRKRELGRGERVLPGVWRLRLPLPWPGVPHCNAWAVAAGDGVVLFDTGMHEPGSFAHLERALGQVNLRVDNVKLLVCTHAHSDHYGQAATIIERTGCELWMHPDHEHMTRRREDPDAAMERRIEIARMSGVPEAPLRAYQEARQGQGFGVAGIVEPDRDLLPGVEVETDLGTFQVVETPGHAPSHVCLYQEDRRILISGDHLLGRVSLYYDYGWTPDPAGEFLESLNRVEDLDMRLCLAGHARPVHRRPGAHHRQPRRRRRAPRGLPARAARARADHRVRRGPARLRRGDHAAERELVAQRDALLSAPPRGHRACGAHGG